MTKKEKRAKKIARALKLVWGSLDSHRAWCYKKKIKGNGGQKFHKKTVAEYAEIISILSELY
jgi:hypothetical protein